MTLTELAKLAHVSTSTASKAFSMSNEINEQTREMIFEVAKKHGCFKKFYRTEYPRCVIAVICPEFESGYYSNMLSVMKKTLAEAGAEMCVSESGFFNRPIDELIKYYDKFNTVDGIIIIGTHSSSDGVHVIPIATIGGRNTRSDVNVVSDTASAIESALEYCAARGVKRVGYVGDAPSHSRMNILKDIASKVGISFSEDDAVIADERFERGGYIGMTRLLDEGDVPRVIFCGYDRMAIGAMRAVSERGMRIPEDVAFIGVDNDPQSEYLTPSLASVSHSIEELCRAAARELTNKIRGKEYNSQVSVKGKFILRESLKI